MFNTLKWHLLLLAMIQGGCATPERPDAAVSGISSGAATDVIAGVEAWIKTELNPQLISDLASQSRFQGRSFRVVTMRNGRRATHQTKLEHNTVALLEGALLQHSNIRLLGGGAAAGECESERRADVHLTVAVEPGAGQATWRLRLLETGSESWVGGYDFSRRFVLDNNSEVMMQSVHATGANEGSKALPFEMQEGDLVSLALADSLICSLGPVARSVPVFLNATDTSTESDGLLSQLASALKRVDLMQIVNTADAADVQLNLSRHPLGDGIVNVTATPIKLRGDPDMPRSASVYQRASKPAVQGENWVTLNELARLPALRQLKMDMPALVQVGETHDFQFSAEQAGRFWVLQVSPNDQLEMIFPVRQEQVDRGENLIAAGEVRNYSFVMEPPTGDYLMSVLLTDKDASLRDILGDSKLASAPDVQSFADKGMRLLEPRDWGMMLHQIRISP